MFLFGYRLLVFLIGGGEKMKNYVLREGVYFVAGAKRGAIYDTSNGKVYSINEPGKKVLQGEIENIDYWRQLGVLDLAVPGKEGISEAKQFPSTGIGLRFMWLELTHDCNERCIHCYASASSKGMGASVKRALTYNGWQRLLAEGFDLGCRKCQLTGGEPFRYRGVDGAGVLDLAGYARNLGYESVEIYTNATLLNPGLVERIQELGLSVAVSLYSSDPEVHNAVTRVPGSHEKTRKSLQLLRDRGVPVRVEVVVMRRNEHTVESTIQWIEEMGFSHGPPDLIRPTGRGQDEGLLPSGEIVSHWGVRSEPDFRADPDFIALSCSGNNCLAGKIAVSPNGDMFPCVFSRDQLLGNWFSAGSLSAVIFGKATQEVWYASKDRVLVCRDCEYRYVCEDCRPLASVLAGEQLGFLTAPSPRCVYNPYTGVWGSGV